MKKKVAIFGVGIAMLVACSSSSGVDGTKSLTSLTNAEYVKVCEYFNSQAESRVGSVCSKNSMKVVSINKLQCGTMNGLAGSACTATVADVERCAQKIDACTLLGATPTPAECSAFASCL